MRGVVWLAAALALPLTLPDGTPFPQRNRILFLTFAVILATLVAQGLSLPMLLRRLGLSDPEAAEREERRARLEAAQAAISRLAELRARPEHHPDHLQRLHWRFDSRSRRLGILDASPEADDAVSTSRNYEELRRDLIAVERATIRKLRDDGVIHDEVMLRVDRELDLEEARIEA